MSGSTFIENNSMIGLDRTSNKVTDKVFSTETSRIVKGKTLTVPGAPTPYYVPGAYGFPNTFFKDTSVGTTGYYILAFSVPISDGGSPIIRYNYQILHYRDSSLLASGTVSGVNTNYFFSFNIGYSLIATITATNAIGTGPAFITNPVCGTAGQYLPGTGVHCDGCSTQYIQNDGNCGYYVYNVSYDGYCCYYP
jgi:hypothetical protein